METCFNAVYVVCDSEDFFTGWVYKLNSPQSIKVNRSEFDEGTGFKHDISASQGVNFIIAIEDLKININFADNVVSDKHFNCFNKYECKPKKVHYQLTNMIVFDIESFNTDTADLYSVCLYKLNKI